MRVSISLAYLLQTDLSELVNVSGIESRLSDWRNLIEKKREQFGPAADSMLSWITVGSTRVSEWSSLRNLFAQKRVFLRRLFRTASRR